MALPIIVLGKPAFLISYFSLSTQLHGSGPLQSIPLHLVAYFPTGVILAVTQA